MSNGAVKNGNSPVYTVGDVDDPDKFERIFRSWRNLRDQMPGVSDSETGDQAENNRQRDFRLAQLALMKTAAEMRGATFRDILYKLALWRWDQPALADTLDDMGKRDALVYSTFRDLAELTGEEDVATDVDRRTDFLRKSDRAAGD